ncbi:MAG: exodeoxyribonuclease III [Alphaproteobacteria bacterium]|nr:exodeoxyribonuclease III [Alphaproteobacteria bacterium]
MRIATWNINSVRLRLPLVRRLAEELRPDVLCLQETKVPDELFPHDGLADLFPHRAVRGMKGYNGVAILSKLPLKDAGGQDWCGKTDYRHIFAKLPSGIELHNLYVPAGGDIPDPAVNDKFAHKLAFIDAQVAWWTKEATTKAKRIVVGDFNIAPLEHDVWSHKQLLDVVSHTPVEVEKLGRLQAAHDWVDGVRHFVPATEKLYSWWSYRARDWRATNRGRRLDHVWVTPALAPKLAAAHIHADARDWPQASDHVPVIVDLGV